jgi:O-antigen biosynthesis protein
LAQYRAQLAPLRFGAGVKGKVSCPVLYTATGRSALADVVWGRGLQIADGWLVGTPTVTTPIGAEGLTPADARVFGGIVARNDAEFIEGAVTLYNDSKIHGACQANGVSLLRTLLHGNDHRAALARAIQYGLFSETCCR